jgi:hypothetical protein
MSIATLILGKSGTGKSTSLRNLDPNETLLIQIIRKPLPFRSKGWTYWDKESNPHGNIFVSERWETIIKLMRGTKRKIIVIDDFQYLLANEFMRRTEEKGFDKFTEIAKHAWEVMSVASDLAPDVRVYMLSHIEENESTGAMKMKTIGKLLDEKITPEGLVTIVLRTVVDGGNYQFATRNSGFDTTKSPMGLFDAERIDNDLAMVDSAICHYYEITTNAADAA